MAAAKVRAPIRLFAAEQREREREREEKMLLSSTTWVVVVVAVVMMAAVGFCSSPSSLLFLFLNKLFRDKTRRDEERYEKSL